MRSPTNYEDSPQMPFIATRGYDSVVWSRLYSRETSELEDYQIEQASRILITKISKLLRQISSSAWFNVFPDFFFLSGK